MFENEQKESCGYLKRGTLKRVLERFNMKSAKPVSTPLASHLKLSKQMCLTTKEEKEGMAKIPYSSAVGSLMYAMVCTRPDIAHAIGVVSRFLEILEKNTARQLSGYSGI